MTTKRQGILANVASSIGATLGAVVAKTHDFAEALQAKEQDFAKSIKRPSRKAKTRSSQAKARKPSKSKAVAARGARTIGRTRQSAKHPSHSR